MATELSVPYLYPIRRRGLRSSSCLRRVCICGLCISVRERYLPITKIGPSYLAYCWLNATALVSPDLLSPSNHRQKWGIVPRKGSISLDLNLVSEVEIPHLNPRIDSGPWITWQILPFSQISGYLMPASYYSLEPQNAVTGTLSRYTARLVTQNSSSSRCSLIITWLHEVITYSKTVRPITPFGRHYCV